MKISLLRKSKIVNRTKPVPVLVASAAGSGSGSTPSTTIPSQSTGVTEKKDMGKFSKLFKSKSKSKSKPSKKVTSEFVDETTQLVDELKGEEVRNSDLPSVASVVSAPPLTAIPSAAIPTTAFPLPQTSTCTSPSGQTTSLIKNLHKKMRLSKVLSVRKSGKKNVVSPYTLRDDVSILSSLESDRGRFSFKSLSTGIPPAFISQDFAAHSHSENSLVDMGMQVIPILPVLPEVVIPSFSTFHLGLGLGLGQIAPAASVSLRHSPLLSKVGQHAPENKSSNHIGSLPGVEVVDENGKKQGLGWLADYSRWLDAKGGKPREMTMIQRASSPGSGCSSSDDSSPLPSPSPSPIPVDDSWPIRQRPSNLPGMYSHLAITTSHSSSNAPLSVSTSSASTTDAVVEVEGFNDARAYGSFRIRIPTAFANGVNTVEFPSIVSGTFSSISSSSREFGDKKTTCEVATGVLGDVDVGGIREVMEDKEAVHVAAPVEQPAKILVGEECEGDAKPVEEDGCQEPSGSRSDATVRIQGESHHDEEFNLIYLASPISCSTPLTPNAPTTPISSTFSHSTNSSPDTSFDSYTSASERNDLEDQNQNQKTKIKTKTKTREEILEETRLDMRARFASEDVRWAFAQLGVDVDKEFLDFEEVEGRLEAGVKVQEREDRERRERREREDAEERAAAGRRAIKNENENKNKHTKDEYRHDAQEAYPWTGIDYHRELWQEHPVHVIYEDEPEVYW